MPFKVFDTKIIGDCNNLKKKVQQNKIQKDVIIRHCSETKFFGNLMMHIACVLKGADEVVSL